MTYDERVSSAYDAAQRDEPRATFAMWMDRFVHHAGGGGRCRCSISDPGPASSPPPWPMPSAGRSSGVEPSSHMRAIAERDRSHPLVTYLDGSADRIPLERRSRRSRPDVPGAAARRRHRAAAAAEIARVLRPGGRLLVVNHFRGEPTPRAWSAYFPEAREIEERACPRSTRPRPCSPRPACGSSPRPAADHRLPQPPHLPGADQAAVDLVARPPVGGGVHRRRRRPGGSGRPRDRSPARAAVGRPDGLRAVRDENMSRPWTA